MVHGLRDAYGAEDPSLPVAGRTKKVVAIGAKVRLEKFPSLCGERERGRDRQREREINKCFQGNWWMCAHSDATQNCEKPS